MPNISLSTAKTINMLDINKIRENKEVIRNSILKRSPEDKDFENYISRTLDEVLLLDEKRRKLLVESETLRAQRNKFSKQKPDQETIKKMREVGDKIKRIEEEIRKAEEFLKNRISELPNIVAEDVVSGGKEKNKVLKTFNKKPNFKFKPKDHVELATNLDVIDYERAAKMSGSGFWIYKDSGAALEWALHNYFIDFHKKNKYVFLIPPFLLTEDSAYASGHLPKFRDDLYWTQDKLCLDATSEMMITNYHRNEILKEIDLPLKYFAYSACFRREAGSYRKEERGMVRGHQFNKIEMFHFTKPENSWKSFDELVKNAEKLVKELGLHFQSVQLAAGDATSAMAKTIDIEVWIPSMNIYKEVSSVSNALDYQARRGNIKYRDQKALKNEFVHTLNGSGLATSRLIPAILEQFQQKDGSVKIPKCLWKYTRFKVLRPEI